MKQEPLSEVSGFTHDRTELKDPPSRPYFGSMEPRAEPTALAQCAEAGQRLNLRRRAAVVDQETEPDRTVQQRALDQPQSDPAHAVGQAEVFAGLVAENDGKAPESAEIERPGRPGGGSGNGSQHAAVDRLIPEDSCRKGTDVG